MSVKYPMFQPEKLNLTSALKKETGSVSHNFLSNRDAKLSNFLIETCLGTYSFQKDRL